MSTMEENTQLLIDAAKHGNAIEVQRLIPLSDPKAHGSAALRWSARNGHAQCVQLLIPVSDSKAHDSLGLRWAAQYGHIQCVQLLIPVSNPKALYSVALQWAAENRHTDCVDLLFDVSDPDVALKRLKTDFPKNPETWQYLEDKITVQHQRELLTQETSQIHSAFVKPRKI